MKKFLKIDDFGAGCFGLLLVGITTAAMGLLACSYIGDYIAR